MGTIVSHYRSSLASYLHFDGLGSTRQATNGLAVVTDTLLYDAWGVGLNHSGSTTIPLTFVGELGYYLDSELLQYYVRRRPYDPRIARWLTCDPIGFTDGLNLFLYVRNQPIFGVDPSGTFTAQGFPAGSSYVVEDGGSCPAQAMKNHVPFCKQACKEASPVGPPHLNNGGGGSVICKDGIRCNCVWDIDYLIIDKKETIKIKLSECIGIGPCAQMHEDSHTGGCPYFRGLGKPPSKPNWLNEECALTRKSIGCLNTYIANLKMTQPNSKCINLTTKFITEALNPFISTCKDAGF